MSSRNAPIFVLVPLALALGLIGCAHTPTAVERELAELKRRFAELERDKSPAPRSDPAPGAAAPPPAFSGPVSLPTANQRPATASPAGPPPLSQTPDPDGRPPLPVVKVKPIRVDPFERRAEPTIRIGKKGRVAPPASTRPQDDPMEYQRIDAYGNLLDEQGRIVYRARPDPTAADGADPSSPEPWEDPHEAPAMKVARALAAPAVEQVPDYAKDYAYDPETRERVRAGVHALPVPQIDQIAIEDHGLPENRETRLRVETEPRIHVPVPAPALAPAPAPVATPMPVVVPPAPTYQRPRAAPGPHEMTKQKSYRGKRERRVQRLYKLALKKAQGRDFAGAEKAFMSFLRKYSNHDLADNALYWLAETAYGQQNWTQALVWFQDVMVRYPEGNKLADAMLKSALCYAQMGDTSYALKLLSEVESLFASQPVAAIARERRLSLAGGGD